MTTPTKKTAPTTTAAAPSLTTFAEAAYGRTTKEATQKLAGEAAALAKPETRQEEQAGPRLRARGGGLPVGDYSTEVDAAIQLGLTATAGRWNGQLQQFEDRPDAKTRLEAAKLWLSYSEGMPVQRQLRLEAAFKDRHAEMLEVARTPSGRKLLLAMGAIDDDWLARAGLESQK